MTRAKILVFLVVSPRVSSAFSYNARKTSGTQGKSNVPQNRRHGNGRVLTSRQEHFIGVFQVFASCFAPKDVSCTFQPWKIGIFFTMYNTTFQVEENLIQLFSYVGKDKMVQRSMIKLGEG